MLPDLRIGGSIGTRFKGGTGKTYVCAYSIYVRDDFETQQRASGATNPIQSPRLVDFNNTKQRRTA